VWRGALADGPSSPLCYLIDIDILFLTKEEAPMKLGQ
jgi:hypothetical protein